MIPCIFLFAGCSGNDETPDISQPSIVSGMISTSSNPIDLTGIPDSLKEKLKKYPEAAEFVSAYQEEHNKHHKIDLTGEYTPGQIPLFIQWDIRWGYETYGDDMIGITGCGPTCLSMVLVGLTGNTSMDPLTVAQFADQNGYYCAGNGSYWTLMSEGAQQLGLYSEELPLNENTIRNRLDMGQPIICAVGAGDFTTDGHFIVLTGINADGTVTINDPNSRQKSQRNWDLQQIMNQIQNLWAISAA